MPDESQQPAAEWLTYHQAAQRLGLRTPNAAAARARRARWAKRIRNTDKAAEILVPGELLATAAPNPIQQREAPPPTPDAPTIGDAVRAAVAPLQTLLDVQAGELREVRAALDAARADLAGAKVEVAAAQARAVALDGEAQNLRAQVDREVADRRTLQAQADVLRDQLASAQIDRAQAVGAANTERARGEAAEARAADLQRQVEALQAKPRRWWWSR